MAGEGFVEVAPPPLSMYRTYIQYDAPLLQILIVVSQIVCQRRNKARIWRRRLSTQAPSLGSVQTSLGRYEVAVAANAAGLSSARGACSKT
jgi:hypothetical protein